MIVFEILVRIIDFKSKIHLFLIPVKVLGPSDSVVAVPVIFVKLNSLLLKFQRSKFILFLFL